MTTTLKLKFLRETAHARLYENSRGVQKWIPRSVCPRTTKLGDQHEVAVQDWWLKENPFENKPQAQKDLL